MSKIQTAGLSPSPLSTLSSSSTQTNAGASAPFLAEIYAQADIFSRLPYILAPSTLPPLSPAARLRIATIQQRCLVDRQRNAPQVFLASCRNWRGELPFGWPTEQRYDEDAELMLWKHEVPDSKEQLAEWRVEWRELRKSENRTSLGALLPGSSKRRKRTTQSKTPASGSKTSQAVPSSTSQPGPVIAEVTPKLELEDDRTVTPASVATPQTVSSSGSRQTSGSTPRPRSPSQQKPKSQSKFKQASSSDLSRTSSGSTTVLKATSQQQLLSFPAALPSSAGRSKGKHSGSLAGMQVEVEVHLSQELPERQKRSWSEIGDMTVFQEYLPPSFPSNLAQSTPPPTNKRRRPSSIRSTTGSIYAYSRSSPPTVGCREYPIRSGGR